MTKDITEAQEDWDARRGEVVPGTSRWALSAHFEWRAQRTSSQNMLLTIEHRKQKHNTCEKCDKNRKLKCEGG